MNIYEMTVMFTAGAMVYWLIGQVRLLHKLNKAEVKEMIIAKIRTQKIEDREDGMLLSVPKDCGLKAGDYVKLEKVE